MYLAYDENGLIKSLSDRPTKSVHRLIQVHEPIDDSVIGKRLVLGERGTGLRVALIANWGDRCGIATYTQLLVNSLRPKVELKIFAEEIADPDEAQDEADNCVRCWRRGTSMLPTIAKVKEWRPDIIFIQHEFGIFPKATHFLKMLEALDGIPYVVTMHSVYEHLDKTICTSYIKNMIVHSNDAKDSLLRNGHTNGNVDVVYHGCVEYTDTSELWNMFQTDYVVLQFGFGFNYKGVDAAIEAVHHLKTTQPDKYKELFYCYLCSESPHTRVIQNSYYNYLHGKVRELGLEENVVILRGYLSEKHICNFLRTAKLAIFPYKNDETNVVYGASGAVRNAMANGIPVIASDCHLFDDLNGTVPRCKNALEFAAEIDRIFSSREYRDSLVSANLKFVTDHNWSATADRHIEVFQGIIERHERDVVRVVRFSPATF